MLNIGDIEVFPCPFFHNIQGTDNLECRIAQSKIKQKPLPNPSVWCRFINFKMFLFKKHSGLHSPTVDLQSWQKNIRLHFFFLTGQFKQSHDPSTKKKNETNSRNTTETRKTAFEHSLHNLAREILIPNNLRRHLTNKTYGFSKQVSRNDQLIKMTELKAYWVSKIILEWDGKLYAQS